MARLDCIQILRKTQECDQCDPGVRCLIRPDPRLARALLLVGYECVDTGRHPASLAAPRTCMQITCFNQPGPRDESWRHGLTLVRRQAG